MKTATFKTTEGDIVLELFVDQMPITTGNFIKLAQEDFYDGVQFHRVIENFMIQSGDPNTKGDDANTYGTGGPGYTIEDEFVEGLSNVRGTISMANTGRPNSGGSQFFINLVDNTGLDFDKQPLTSKHPVFGKVIEGMEVVDAIGKTDTNFRDLPETPIVINDIVIEDR
ncbi:peptidylprolyl isomerase [bacterium]|nr:peptidylprolyl isomerase [bacterium]